MRVAQAHAGESCNDIIPAEVDPLSGTARLTEVAVEVTTAEVG